jgi:hypothetical protein
MCILGNLGLVITSIPADRIQLGIDLIPKLVARTLHDNVTLLCENIVSLIRKNNLNG